MTLMPFLRPFKYRRARIHAANAGIRAASSRAHTFEKRTVAGKPTYYDRRNGDVITKAKKQERILRAAHRTEQQIMTQRGFTKRPRVREGMEL